MRPKPAFDFTEQTRDHIGEMRPGFTYQVAWKDVGTLGFGVQKPHYRKRTLMPGRRPA